MKMVISCRSVMFHWFMITVLVCCVHKSHSDSCEPIPNDPEPTTSVCFTNLRDWIPATKQRENGSITLEQVGKDQFILQLKDNMFFNKFRENYTENNTINLLKQERSIEEIYCSRDCRPDAKWIRPQEFYRIITPAVSNWGKNITKCQGLLESKVVDIETGCYQFRFNFNAFNVCYWLETNWNFTTEYPRSITTAYSDVSGVMTVTWNQTLRKPALLKLIGSSGVEMTFICCAPHKNFCPGRQVKVKCNHVGNTSTINCSFGPDLPKDNYELFIAEEYDLNCIERRDCIFLNGSLKINLLNLNSTHNWQNLKPFVWTIGLLVAAVLSIIAVIWCFKLHHPASQSSGGLDQGTDLITLKTNSLLVLYPDDCPKLHEAMGIFCNLLGCNGQCEVYDIMHQAVRSQVLNDGAYEWLTAKLTEVDKVILVETHASHILQFTEVRYHGKHNNSINMSLAQFYHNYDKTFSSAGSREKLIRVRLNGFSPVLPLIKLYNPHSTSPSVDEDIPYILPQALPLLMKHLGLDVGEGELEEAISRFSESLERLIHYKINHKNYIQDILMQMD